MASFLGADDAKTTRTPLNSSRTSSSCTCTCDTGSGGGEIPGGEIFGGEFFRRGGGMTENGTGGGASRMLVCRLNVTSASFATCSAVTSASSRAMSFGGGCRRRSVPSDESGSGLELEVSEASNSLTFARCGVGTGCEGMYAKMNH